MTNLIVLLVLTTLLVSITISTGLVTRFKDKTPFGLKSKSAIKINLTASFVMFLGLLISTFSNGVFAASSTSSQASPYAYIAAALAVGFSVISTGYAVATVGAAALGAITEKPNLLGKTLIILGLAEGIAIYGLIVAIMILGKI